MKNVMRRIVAAMLCVLTFTELFSGCAAVSKTDEHLTKGEFMCLFVDEVGVTQVNEFEDVSTSTVEDRYRFAEKVLMQLGYLGKKETADNLQKAVTK